MSDETRKHLVTAHANLVPMLYRVYAHMFPRTDLLTRADYLQEGYLGLLDAARLFEPNQSVTFTTYARFRILGAMRDALREQAPLSRWSAMQGIEPPQRVPFPTWMATVSRDFCQIHARLDAQRILARLDPDDCAILRAVYQQDQSQIALARARGKSTTWASWRVRQALRRARRTAQKGRSAKKAK